MTNQTHPTLRLHSVAVTLVLALVVGAATAGCGRAEPAEPRAAPVPSAAASAPATPPPSKPATVFDRATLGAFAPLPTFMGPAEPTPAKVKLGQTLFHDPRLSRGQDVSCNTCHALTQFGVDNKPTSSGFKGQKGGRNSPTVLNAAGHFAQFWDGRAPDVEAQAKGPVLNPIEMAMADDKEVMATLKTIPGYADLFQAAFPADKDPVTWDHYAAAVGAFERKLVTPSRFDRFFDGDDAALTDVEKKGLTTFVASGCTVCHAGAYVGGALYQKAGLVQPWPNQADKGRGALTKNAADDMFFKVPSLRNVDKTAPYFHDGSVGQLTDAVKMMSRHQLGRELSDDDTASIVSFLGALTGELPAELVATPVLPPSGPKTPRPRTE